MDNLAPQDHKLKSFWSRTEGTVGMATIAVMVIGGAVVIQMFQSFFVGLFYSLIAMIGSTLAALLLIAILAVVVSVVTNPRFRTLCSYYFKFAIQKATNVFIPVFWKDILMEHLKNANSRREIIVTQTSELNGQIKTLELEVKKNEQEIEKLMAEASVAQKMNKQLAMSAALQEAQSKRASNNEYNDALKQMHAMLDVFNKYIEFVDYLIRKLKSDITENIRKKNLMDKAAMVMSASKAIMNGKTDEDLLYDETTEWMAQDYGQKLGQVEEFMNQTKPLIERFDMNRMADLQMGLKSLEEWQVKNQLPMSAGSKQEVVFTNTPAQTPVFIKK